MTALDPIATTALRVALLAQHASPQFARALDKAIGAVEGGQPFVFDGRTLIMASQSNPSRSHTTDGAACSCEGARHAWCYHRSLWSLLVLHSALTDPHGLLAPADAELELEAA